MYLPATISVIPLCFSLETYMDESPNVCYISKKSYKITKKKAYVTGVRGESLKILSKAMALFFTRNIFNDVLCN